MAQYIPKDALVAEINKRLEGERFLRSAEELNYLLCFINTLEVKEVNEEPYVMGKTGRYSTTTK